MSECAFPLQDRESNTYKHVLQEYHVITSLLLTTENINAVFKYHAFITG